EMLDALARRAGMDDGEREELAGLNRLDRAVVIEKRLGGAEALMAAVRDLFDRHRYGLTHALLASLPVGEAVTTNYDRLFELAWAARGRRFSVLPYALRPGADAWVLKLHGSVDHPEDIVLTRAHLFAAEERNEALAGAVQALLLTRHMLFVGFSLTDEDFHRIAAAVRRVLRGLETPGGAAEPFGTAVVLRRNRLVRELWGDDLRWAEMD